MADDQDKKEDAQLIELLNELRVALPGVQVLFAFLLAVPFTQRFEKVSTAEEYAYFLSLFATAIGSVLLMAPTAYHRLRWREGAKGALLRTSNRLAIAGTVFLAIGMTAAVFLVTDLVFHAPFTALATAGIAAAFAWFWFGLPLWDHVRGRR